MLLHVGNDVMIPLSDIIFILDINTYSKSKINQHFIDRSKNKIIHNNQKDTTSKSLIVMKKGEKTILYYSPISSITLKKRAENFLNDYTLA